MKNSAGCYPRVEVDTAGSAVVSHAAAVLLTRGAHVVGLDTALLDAFSPWTKPLATHRPGKVVLDLAITLALGGDCLADVAVLRAEPGVFGLVGSDATVSRTITALAADAKKTLPALKKARAVARARAWAAAGAAALRLGPRHHRRPRPVLLTQRLACDRAQGTPASRCATHVHRH